MTVSCYLINFSVTVPYAEEFFSFVLIACLLLFFHATFIYSVITPWRRQPPSWVLVQRMFTSSKQMKGKQGKATAVVSEPFKNAVVLYITSLFECNWKVLNLCPLEVRWYLRNWRNKSNGPGKRWEGERVWRRVYADYVLVSEWKEGKLRVREILTIGQLM